MVILLKLFVYLTSPLLACSLPKLKLKLKFKEISGLVKGALMITGGTIYG